MSGTTLTNLPNGTSQEVFYPSVNDPTTAGLVPFGISETLVNLSGPNGSGTATSIFQAFTNGDSMTFLTYPDGNIGQVAATYSGNGIAFNPEEASFNACLGTNAFNAAATNSTISDLLASYSDGLNAAGIPVLTGGVVDYTNGTSAVLQNSPSGPAETDYSGPNGTGTVLGGSFYGTGTDLGTALAIAVAPGHSFG